MVEMFYFSAKSGLCVRMLPVIRALQAEGHTVTEVEFDNEALADQFGVRARPTIIITKDDVPVRRIVGPREKWTLESELRLAEDA